MCNNQYCDNGDIKHIIRFYESLKIGTIYLPYFVRVNFPFRKKKNVRNSKNLPHFHFV